MDTLYFQNASFSDNSKNCCANRYGEKGDTHDKVIFDESIENLSKSILNFHQNSPSGILGDKGYQDKTSDFLDYPI